MKKLHELAEGDLVSETSQGAGWWQANDGKWYSPEQHPDYRPPPTAPAPPYVALPVVPTDGGKPTTASGTRRNNTLTMLFLLRARSRSKGAARATQYEEAILQEGYRSGCSGRTDRGTHGLASVEPVVRQIHQRAPPSPAAAAQSGSTSMSALVSACVNYYNQSRPT